VSAKRPGDRAFGLVVAALFCAIATIGWLLWGQILFWALGVGMMWFLAYKMEMSTMPDKEVEALTEDIGDTAVQPAAE